MGSNSYIYAYTYDNTTADSYDKTYKHAQANTQTHTYANNRVLPAEL